MESWVSTPSEKGAASVVVKVETVMDLLDAKEWEACANLAAKALAEGEYANEQKALLNFARCKSLSNLDRYTAALEPGHSAAILGELAKDFDLLGRSLLELAWVQHKIPGMERSAVDTQRRFFDYFPRYKTIRDRYLSAQFNLAVYYRASGLFAEAFEHFKTVYQEARKRGDQYTSQLSRSAAVWEALRLEKVQEAEALIREGDRCGTDDPRLLAVHLIDRAQLCMLKQNPANACDYVLKAISAIEKVHTKDGHLLPQALEILHRIANHFGDVEAAIRTALFAKVKAEADDRHDLVAQICDSVRTIALLNPKAVEKVMATID